MNKPDWTDIIEDILEIIQHDDGSALNEQDRRLNEILNNKKLSDEELPDYSLDS